MSSGANVIRQMENKIQNFVIEIGESTKSFQFNQADPIFKLDSPNQDNSAE